MYPTGIEYVGAFNESGFARVQLDTGEWAYIDTEGNLQEGRYYNAWSYRDGKAPVWIKASLNKDENRHGFVDINGKICDEGNYKYQWVGFHQDCLNNTIQEGYPVMPAFCVGDSEYLLKKYSNWNVEKVKFEDGRYSLLLDGKRLLNGRYFNVEPTWTVDDFEQTNIATVTLDQFGSFRCNIDEKENYYFNKKDWKEYIKKHPESFSNIPPHRFEDKSFMKMINEILQDHYKTTLSNDKITPKEFKNAISEIENKKLAVEQELQRRREALDKIRQNPKVRARNKKLKLQQQEEEKTQEALDVLNKSLNKNLSDDDKFNDDQEQE